MVVGTGKGTEEKMTEKMLTDDEAALYDRQLRLWGVEAQKRLIGSKILIIGMTGLGAEICKNIVLGGVNSVTLMDDQVVSQVDTVLQFFLSKDSVGKNRADESVSSAQKLNPMVRVVAETSTVEEKPDKFFLDFSVIVTVGRDRKDVLRLNRLARANGIAFFAADVFGFSSYLFSDLGNHSYKKEINIPATKNVPEVNKVVEGVLHYVPFQDILSIVWSDEKYGNRVKKMDPSVLAFFVLLEFAEKYQRRPDPSERDEDYQRLIECRDQYAEKHGLPKEKIPDEYFENVFGELPPVSAITGGVVAQEVVKAVSHKDIPLINVFVYHAVSGTGFVEDFTM